MKNQPAMNWLVPLIFILALFAAGSGLFWKSPAGQPFAFQSARGEKVMIDL